MTTHIAFAELGTFAQRERLIEYAIKNNGPCICLDKDCKISKEAQKRRADEIPKHNRGGFEMKKLHEKKISEVIDMTNDYKDEIYDLARYHIKNLLKQWARAIVKKNLRNREGLTTTGNILSPEINWKEEMNKIKYQNDFLIDKLELKKSDMR